MPLSTPRASGLGLFLALLVLSLSACNVRMAATPQVEMSSAPPLPAVPPPSAAAAWVPEGYEVAIAVQDLVYPTSVTFGDDGAMYVAEAGYSYGDPAAPPRVLRIAADGAVSVAASGLSGPINDVLWHEGRLYISHRGKISAMEPGGAVRDLVTGLPSLGDHHNNQLAVGPDGMLYFGQGTATNSGVVGLDNFAMGWLRLHPFFSDTPAQPLRLTGRTFTSINPLMLTAEDEGPVARTSGFAAFDSTLERTGSAVKANGTVLRMNTDGSGLEVYAWGLRNPFGVAWGPDGRLYVAENGFDERGSRPIANAADNLWAVEQGAWYGWPDYASGIPVTDARFKPGYAEQPEFLMEEHPPVGTPLVTFAEHAAVTQLAAGPGGPFGRHLYVGQFGDMTPLTGQTERPTGYQVARVDPATGAVEPFFYTRPGARGPAGLEYFATAGPKRPVGVAFSPDGGALYVADFGAFTIVTGAAPVPTPVPGTGVVWRITRSGTRVDGPTGVSAAPGGGR